MIRALESAIQKRNSLNETNTDILSAVNPATNMIKEYFLESTDTPGADITDMPYEKFVAVLEETDLTHEGVKNYLGGN